MQDNYIEANGIETLVYENGKCTMRMPVTPDKLNPYGIVHGGVIYGLADTAAGYAAASAGAYCVTVDSSVSYLRQGKNTAFLKAEAEVIKNGHTIVFVRVSVTDDRDKSLAFATFQLCVTGTDATD